MSRQERTNTVLGEAPRVIREQLVVADIEEDDETQQQECRAERSASGGRTSTASLPMPSGEPKQRGSWLAPSSSSSGAASAGERSRSPARVSATLTAPILGSGHRRRPPPRRNRGESGATAGVAKIHTLPDMEKGIADTEFSEKAPDKLKPDPEALTKLKKKRAGVLKELYHTEKQYVEDMETITNLFLEPIRQKNLLSREEIAALFANIEALVPVNQQLFADISRVTQKTEESESDETKTLAPSSKHQNLKSLISDERGSSGEPSSIGEIFVERGDLLKLYAVYCSNQPNIAKRLREYRSKYKAFDKFVKKAIQKDRCRRLDMESFLIMPLQRLCKYPLLLKEIHKNTHETEEEYPVLENAMAKIKVIVDAVNERVRKVENVNKLMDVAETIVNADKYDVVDHQRRLLYDGDVDYKERKGHLFLFNDKVLLCRCIAETPYVGPQASRSSETVSPSLERGRSEGKNAPRASAKQKYMPKYMFDLSEIVFQDVSVSPSRTTNGPSSPHSSPPSSPQMSPRSKEKAKDKSKDKVREKERDFARETASAAIPTPATNAKPGIILGAVKSERLFVLGISSNIQRKRWIKELTNVLTEHPEWNQNHEEDLAYLAENMEKFKLKRKKEKEKEKRREEKQKKRAARRDKKERAGVDAHDKSSQERLIALMKELAHEKKERKRIEAWGKNLDMILGDALEEVRSLRATNKGLESKVAAVNLRASASSASLLQGEEKGLPGNDLASSGGSERLIKEFEARAQQLAAMVDSLTKENIRLRRQLQQAKMAAESDDSSDDSDDNSDSDDSDSDSDDSDSDSDDESDSDDSVTE